MAERAIKDLKDRKDVIAAYAINSNVTIKSFFIQEIICPLPGF